MDTIEVKANPEKIKAVEFLEEKVKRAEGMVFADYRGLTVAKMDELRGKFHKNGTAEFLVAKNTLFKIALANNGSVIADESVIKGPTGIAFGYEDPVSPAKILADFAKDNDKLVLKGAIVDGEFYDKTKVEELAKMPPVEQLYAMIVGSVASPLSDFVGVLNETVRSFVGVIDAVIEKKKAEEAA